MDKQPTTSVAWHDALDYAGRRRRAAAHLWRLWHWPKESKRQRLSHVCTTLVLLWILALIAPKLLPDEVWVVAAYALAIVATGLLTLGVAYVYAGAQMEVDLNASWKKKQKDWRETERALRAELKYEVNRLEGEHDETQNALTEIADSRPNIEAELTTTQTRNGTAYVISVRNTGADGVFHASMVLSGDQYVLTGHHRMYWTRGNGQAATISHNDEDYLHIADVALRGDGGPGSIYTMHLFHFDPFLHQKEQLLSLSYAPGQGPEVGGIARVTISTEPKARNGAWTQDIHFTVRRMCIGPFPAPSEPRT